MNRLLSLQSPLFKRSIDGPLVLLLLPNGANVGSKHMATASGGEQSAKSSGTGPPLATPKRKSESEFRSYWNRVMRAEEEALKKTRPWQNLEYIPLHDQNSILCSVNGEFLHNNYHFGGKPSSFSPKTQEELNEEICKKYEQEHGKRRDDAGWFERRKMKKDIDARIADSCSVVQLQYPFGPAIAAPSGVDPTQWREIFEQARVYLLGCTHGSEESRKNAESLVAAVQPDVVMVELCQERSKEYIGTTEGDSKAEMPMTQEEFNEEVYKKYEQEHGKRLLDDLFWFERRELNKELRRIYLRVKHILQMMRDNEFRTAFFAAQKVPGCAGVVLGDLPYFIHTAEWIEQIRSAENLWMARMRLQLADIRMNLLDKRDKHMVSVLHTMLHRCTIEKLSASERIGVEFEPVTAIAVVGKAHLKGMEERWSKPEQVYPLQ